MPYDIVTKHPKCPSSRPVAVVKSDGGRVMGCHVSDSQAKKQQSALYASEGNLKFLPDSYFEVDELRDARTREINERFLVMASNIISNRHTKDKVGALHALVDEYLERIDDWQAG